MAQEKAARDKAAQEKTARDKAAQEKLAQEKAAKEQALQKKLAADKAAAKKQSQQAALDDRKLEQARQDQLRRIAAMAGSGDAGSSGSAAKSSGPSAGYAGRIVARVRPNITYTESPQGNPTAVVEVFVAPDGTILRSVLKSSSGLPSWDSAVLNAIQKTEVLPRDIDGRIPPSMELLFRPKD